VGFLRHSTNAIGATAAATARFANSLRFIANPHTERRSEAYSTPRPGEMLRLRLARCLNPRAARGKCPTGRVLPCSSKGLNTYVQLATPQRFPCRTRRCFGPCSRCGSLWKTGEIRKSRVDFRVCSPYSSQLFVCHSAGQGGLSLFDNRYDVPESVRTVPVFELERLSNSSDNNLLGSAGPGANRGFVFLSDRFQTRV